MSIFQSALDGIIGFDDQGTIEMVNPAAERLFGCPAQEMIGKNVNLFVPDLYSRVEDQFLEASVEGIENRSK